MGKIAKRTVLRAGMRVVTIYDPSREFRITRSVLPQRLFFEKGNKRGYLKSELLPAGRVKGKSGCHPTTVKPKVAGSRSLSFQALPRGILAKSSPQYRRTCKFCGTEFTAKRKTAAYCPDKPCRINHWKARNVSPAALSARS